MAKNLAALLRRIEAIEERLGASGPGIIVWTTHVPPTCACREGGPGCGPCRVAADASEAEARAAHPEATARTLFVLLRDWSLFDPEGTPTVPAEAGGGEGRLDRGAGRPTVEPAPQYRGRENKP